MKHSLNEQLMARKAAATPRGVGVMGSFFVDKALNSELWDIEGRRFIDFAGGIAVMNTGHRHPKVVQAMQAQLERFTHTCYQVVPYESYIALAEKLNALTPGTHAKKTALFSTGAEAVENAIKIARAATKRSGVIAFSGAFHGRSMFAVAMTGKVQPYKADFGPFPPEIFHAPFPCHCANLDEVKKAIHHIFKSDIEPARVAAIIFEPVQGEGGFNVI
jgi:4-aminobutyrate aminotransferase